MHLQNKLDLRANFSWFWSKSASFAPELSPEMFIKE